MVNKLLKQHKMMTTMMKRMSNGGRGALDGMDQIPPEFLNNLK
jgi:Signal recognition particle GTPase